MAQYINKADVVAEIVKRIKETESMQPKFDQFWAGQISAFKGILKILDTLEVKEVNLEEELDEWMKCGPHTNYPWCTIPDAIKITAEHFFELGIKIAQKEE